MLLLAGDFQSEKGQLAKLFFRSKILQAVRLENFFIFGGLKGWNYIKILK